MYSFIDNILSDYLCYMHLVEECYSLISQVFSYRLSFSSHVNQNLYEDYIFLHPYQHLIPFEDYNYQICEWV